MKNKTMEEDHGLYRAKTLGTGLLARVSDKPGTDEWQAFRRAIVMYMDAIEYERQAQQHVTELWDLGVSVSKAVAEGIIK